VNLEISGIYAKYLLFRESEKQIAVLFRVCINFQRKFTSVNRGRPFPRLPRLPKSNRGTGFAAQLYFHREWFQPNRGNPKPSISTVYKDALDAIASITLTVGPPFDDGLLQPSDPGVHLFARISLCVVVQPLERRAQCGHKAHIVFERARWRVMPGDQRLQLLLENPFRSNSSRWSLRSRARRDDLT
jgi:hypothetical protein